MAQKQNIQDGGSIIGYRPTLEYKKDGNSTEIQAEKSTEQYTSFQDKKYSTTLINFINTSPNRVLQTLLATSEHMQKLIEKLSKDFPNSTYEEYGSIASYLTALECGNNEFAMEFMNWHKHDLNGSQIPELIDCIYCGKHRLDVISDTVKQLYYGNTNLTIENAKEIDDAHIAQMKIYENSYSNAKINYYAISIDAELNRLILMHCSAVKKDSMRISTITKDFDDTTVQSSNIDLIRDLYSEVNTELDNRLHTFNTQQNVDIIEKALYNYYKKRKSVLGLYSLLNDSKSSTLFYSKLEKRQKDVQEALGNVNRSFKAYELYASKFNELEREKHFLKDVYASLNYNSNN